MAEKKTILIVDDEKINRFLLRGILSDEYNILEAPNGRLAVQAVKENRNEIALILLDIVMPAMDGFETVEQLKKMDVLKEIPILFVTAEYDDEKVKRGLALGVAEVIKKPFDPFEIKNRVNNIIEIFQNDRSMQPAQGTNKRDCIVIVDDEEINRELLRLCFMDQYSIVTAEGGRQAVELIRKYKERIALIMLDIVMPGFDGFAVIAELKKDNYIFDNIPVIFISAETNKKNVMRGLSDGVSDIIKKPFDPAVVRRRAENLIHLFWQKQQQSMQQ